MTPNPRRKTGWWSQLFSSPKQSTPSERGKGSTGISSTQMQGWARQHCGYLKFIFGGPGFILGNFLWACSPSLEVEEVKLR